MVGRHSARGPRIGMPWRWLPNALTVLRLALVVPIACLLWQHSDRLALACFMVAAFSDYADGALARRWGIESRFGAVTDPIADKLTTLAAAGMLTWQGSLPLAYLGAVALRDLVIVGGATAWRLRFGSVEMAPSWISKLNTALNFLLLLWTMGVRADLLPGDAGWNALSVAAIATTLASGADYVWVWGRKALRRSRPEPDAG
ncbi:MAG: CDP-alcohol phosphatidyltransferase family protein [Burkholderiaceae bacterium]